MKFKRIFFLYLLAEVFLLGSGQDFHVIGALTLRMFNFLIALFVVFVSSAGGDNRISNDDTSWLFMYTILLLLGTFIGLLNEPSASFEKIFLDLKPLAFFYLLPYLSYSIRSYDVIDSVIKLFVKCMQILIITYLAYLLAMEVGSIVPYEVVYATLGKADSIIMRDIGYAFFYKGFVFIPIASVLFYNRKDWIWLILSVIVIFYTFTRGFYVMLIIGFIFNYLIKYKISFIRLIVFLVLLFIVYQIIDYFQIFEVSEDREGGDADRILTIQQVFSAITPFSMLVGHGFGHGVPIKQYHMEMCYMEILHKQGIVGLAFWFILLIKILRFRYVSFHSAKSKEYVDFFVVAAALIYIQSLFNPYLLNPIGMTMVLLSYVCSRFIVKNENFMRNRPVQVDS